jgi:small conductance mechanosensitive channel
MTEALTELWSLLRTPFVRVGLTLLVAVFCYQALQVSLTQLERRLAQHTGKLRVEQQRQAITLLGALRSIGVFIISLSAVLVMLSQLGVEIGPMLAGAGLIGIAIGLSLQTLMQDLVGGLLIIIEDQFHLGDVIAVGAVTGKVERITLRVTYVRDADGTLHIVPNGTMRVVSNHSRKQ